MRGIWRKFFLRSGALFLAIFSLESLSFSNTATTGTFLVGVMYVFEPLDKVREEDGEWEPLVIGFLIYVLAIVCAVGYKLHTI